MGMLRNRSFKMEIVICVAAVAIMALAGSYIGGKCALTALITGIVLIGIQALFTRQRYNEVRKIADGIDDVLFDSDKISFNECNEGEFAILNDELKKLIRKMREQTELLSDEKRTLTEAISDIFHQLRTPLTSLKLMVSLIKDENADYGKRRKIARDMDKLLERTRWLIETLLKMSKIDSGTALFNREEVSVAKLAEQATDPLMISMELREQTLELNIGDERFTGDMQWTTEALANIVKNCVEHTPTGGYIRISAEENLLYTEIKITDSGEGFEKKDIPHLFERFYKGQNSGSESIGIGLALARSVITAQNGSVVADNAEDGGAEFVIRFYKSII